jgi:hypothetical protein
MSVVPGSRITTEGVRRFAPDMPSTTVPAVRERAVQSATVACRLRGLFGRRFVWLDDEITDGDRRWVQAHHPSKALLHRVDSFVGLTDADFAVIRQWLAGR